MICPYGVDGIRSALEQHWDAADPLLPARLIRVS